MPPVIEAPPRFPDHDLCFVTVCTASYVPYARTLLESLREHHGEVPFVVAVVDASHRRSVDLDGTIVLTGRDIFGPDLDFHALKYNAYELCCVAKPHALAYLLTHAPATKFIYLDSDLYLFAPLEAMLSRLATSNFVVTPHTLAPLPRPDRFWERPSLGDLAFAGVMNAGMFAFRQGEQAAKFLDTWKWMVSAPGAFVGSQGGQTEQNAFNWLTCFADGVAVLRDASYNVAYWNLHDRSLRYWPADQGRPRWTVNGKPLVAFHFSGFSREDRSRLSRYENRNLIHAHPALARLSDFYVERITANDHGELEQKYPFASFPSGVPIDDLMRDTFRKHEDFMRRDISPWTPEGEAHYARALLSPVPYTRSLLPALLHRIIEGRHDLQHGGNGLDPSHSMRWFRDYGLREYGYEALYDRHRPAVMSHHGGVLLTALHDRWPRLFDGLDAPLRQDRRLFIERLQRVVPDESRHVHDGVTEYYALSQIGLVRHVLVERPDLTKAFPDLLFADARAFAHWLRQYQGRYHFIPTAAIETFAAKAEGRALARVYSCLARGERWPETERWPLGLVGVESHELACLLMAILRHSVEFDFEDVMMFVWIMDVAPWAGIPLTLELPLHATRHPSSRSREGQDQILAPLLARDVRFVSALAAYRAVHPPVRDPHPPSVRSTQAISVYSVLDDKIPARKKFVSRPRTLAPGVNVFGYHKSEIGLGLMSKGLVQALHYAGEATSLPILTNVKMDADLEPSHFARAYDTAKGTNVIVSYPHMRELILETIPDEVRLGHRNIAYLAWEQRGGTHFWKDVYSGFDQVWALSDFAAESLSSVLEREVHSVPCVVDTTVFPKAATKEQMGLDPRETTFLFIFDANSSMVRKNPDAVVEAFQQAFRADDAARLIVKFSNGTSLDHRASLRRLLAKIGGHPKIEIRSDYLTRADLYGLISACDCYVSLHRAEGFGYTCAEAMTYEKPVIATGYSGNMQFMCEGNSYPVRYTEVESEIGDGPFPRGGLWAEADVGHAAEMMRRVFESPDEAARKGVLGRKTIVRDLAPAAIGERVAGLLRL